MRYRQFRFADGQSLLLQQLCVWYTQRISSATQISNCVFILTEVGITSYYGALTVVNCTFAFNGTGVGNGGSSSTVVTNCVLWYNAMAIESYGESSASVSFSNMPAPWSPAYDGAGNVSAPPCSSIISSAISACGRSACIDTGASVGAPADDMVGHAAAAGRRRGHGCL